jgi:hypothetical protein
MMMEALFQVPTIQPKESRYPFKRWAQAINFTDNHKKKTLKKNFHLYP